MNRQKKVLVIGLDCAPPELVFEQWCDALPNFEKRMDDGVWSKLERRITAMTMPAWSSMMSSKDLVTLGSNGFGNRGDYSYEKHILVNSNSVKVDRVWNVLPRREESHHGWCAANLSPKPINGIQVGCFLSPSTKKPEQPYTIPCL